jgi:hypothetical protein
MKAWLVLQEGPGAGPSYPLDPFKQPLLSLGRSSGCHIVVNDQRVSRHHGDIRWNGRQWEVVDRGSINGTYVNGVQIHRPWELQLGDRVTVGETTMVLREYSEQPAAPPRAQPTTQPYRAGMPPQQTPELHRGQAQQASAVPAQIRTQKQVRIPTKGQEQSPERHREQASADTGVAFWLGQGLIVAAVVCLAAGAFLPWFRVTGSLSSDLGALVEGITSIVSSLIGDNLLSVTQDISALSGFGKLTLGIAVVCIILLFVDIFLRGRSIVPGLVYVLISAAVGVVVAMDLKGLYDLYQQVQSISVLFGIRLESAVKAFGKFIDVQVTLLPGLYLTAAGLGLLLVGGIVRLLAALSARGRSARS